MEAVKDQQEQTQTQNNNQNVTVTLAAPSSAPVVLGVQSPKVVSSTQTDIKELPKTGLPLALWGVSALIPLGLKLRKNGSSSETEKVSANSIWMNRELQK